MKKPLLLTLLAAFMAANLYAALSNAGGIPNWKTQKNGNGDIVIYGVQVGPDGTPVPTPGGAVTFPTPTPGIQPVTVTAMPGIDGVTHQTFTWNQTPTAYNLSTTAGTAGKKYIFRMEGMPGPCAAASIELDSSASASAGFNSGWGAYIPLSTTGGIAYGPYSAGMHVKGRSLSSTNCNGSFVVETLP